MKFYNELDEKLFNQELKTSELDEVGFIKRRKELVKRLKDRKKSNMSKQVWRKNRFKIMKGIKKFHKSTKGKRFHRDLGRFLATRDLSGLAYSECQELVVPIMSCLTHVYYELSWYMNIEDNVDYEVFSEEVYDEVFDMLGKLRTYNANLEDNLEFLYRLCETSNLIKAFADRYSKSKEDIEKLWNKIKQDLINSGKKEEDEGFYKALVGTLKKILQGSNKRLRILKK